MKRRGFLGALIGIGVVRKTGLPKPVENPFLSPVEKDYLTYANLMQKRPLVAQTFHGTSCVYERVSAPSYCFPVELWKPKS